jgi:hypothetical protein
LRRDQADALAGFEAVVAGVAGMAATGQPDAAFEHGQLAAATAQPQRAAGGDAAGMRGRRGRKGQQGAVYELRSHHESPDVCAAIIVQLTWGSQ